MPDPWRNAPPVTIDQALGRKSKIVPIGADNQIPLSIPSPVASLTIDARKLSCVGWAFYDDFFNSSDEFKRNNKTFRIGQVTPASGLVVVGGLAKFLQPPELTWTDMKHGTPIQRRIDNGEDAKSNPTQDGCGYLIGVKDWAYVVGARVYSCMDGIRTEGALGAKLYTRSMWLRRVRDTGWGAENGQLISAYDCLMQGYGMVDVRNSPPLQGSENVWQDCIFDMWLLPGGHGYPSWTKHHHSIYKQDENSARLRLINCSIILRDPQEGPSLPSDGSYENVKIYWQGPGAYPHGSQTPRGIQVINTDGKTLVTAKDRSSALINEWIARHGYKDFNTVLDAQKIIFG